MACCGGARARVCVRMCVGRTDSHTSEEERKPGEEKMVKAEELCNAARIHTELFWPAYQQPGQPGPRGTERMGEERWRRKSDKFVIF